MNGEFIPVFTVADDETPNIGEMAAASKNEIAGLCENTAVNQYNPGCNFCESPVISLSPVGLTVSTVPRSASKLSGKPLESL